MAIIGGLLGGGSIFGGLLSTAFGIGIKIAISYFFPQKVQGPRAENLKAQTSRFGDHLARSYGTHRLAGAAIWLKGNKVDEHVRTERQGKALGPEVTSYSYTATFAVAFAWNGPFAAVPRIWADDKLIFDESTDIGVVTGSVAGAEFTIYLGTDSQDSDPDIEADQGTGLVPAWPGRCYIVIKNLPLDEFGIRIPNIEAELVRTGEFEYLSREYDDAPDDVAGYVKTDTDGTIIAHTNADADHVIIETITGTIIADHAVAYFVNGIHASARGDVLVFGDDNNIYVYNSGTGVLTQTIAFTTTSMRSTAEYSVGGTTYVAASKGFNLALLGTSGSGWSILWDGSQGFGGALATTSSMGPDYIYLTDSDDHLWTIAWTGLARGTATQVTAHGTPALIFASYDASSDSLIVVATLGTNLGQIFVLTPDGLTVLRSVVSQPWGTSLDNPNAARLVKTSSARFAFLANDGHVYEYRLSDLEQLLDYSLTVWGLSSVWTGGVSGAIPGLNALLINDSAGLGAVIYLPRIGRAGEPLADIIEAECNLAGLVPDVNEITTDVLGYAVRDGSPPRGVIEDLARVNFFDFAQIDGTITFFPRNTTSMRTLTIAETGMVLNGEPDPVQIAEEYSAALDIPEQVIIGYPSWDALYRQGAQAGNPDENDFFNDELSEADETGASLKVRRTRAMQFSTAQVLTDDQAAQVADIIFRDLADAATFYRTNLGPEHLDLHPGLVVLLPLDDTRTAKAVLTKQAGETVLECEFRKRGDSFESEAVGQPTPYVEDTLLGMADATPVLIDGHLMRAEDDNDGFYDGVAVTSTGQFRGALIYQSEDGGSTYLTWAAFSESMVRGLAVGALPDRPHPEAFDRASELIIAVPQGTAPDSVTEESLLSSETLNGFAVWNATLGDWEYIRAASVVDNLDGTWTLSTLLRGRKGTEFAMSGHAIGDVVYYLDLSVMARATDGDRTLSRIYVATPTSTRFDSTGAVTFTNYGKGLRPWAPAFSSAALDSGTGDWTFTWHRRDRLGQEWPESGTEDPPMSEDDEEYTVNIYDGVGVLVNSYASVTESYVYTAADQTTDFGSPQTSIEFGISQVSAVYGDGIEMREAA